MSKTQLYSVYIGQNGNNLRAVLTEEDARKVMNRVHRKGAPFTMWMTLDGGISRGITVNPRAGAVVLNIEPAVPIPVDAQGNLCVPGGPPQVKELPPEEQGMAKILDVEWPLSEADGALADLVGQLSTMLATAYQLMDPSDRAQMDAAVAAAKSATTTSESAPAAMTPEDDPEAHTGENGAAGPAFDPEAEPEEEPQRAAG